MNFVSWFTGHHPEIQPNAIQAVLKLHDEGSTIPFIARYRKEQTGNLDEVQIQKVILKKEDWDEITKRQKFIASEIEKNTKIAPSEKTAIIDKVLNTFSKAQLEDLFLPYKQKKKTRATKAREAGLEPLADWIWNCAHGLDKPQAGQTLELWALTYKNEEAKIVDAESAISGAQDILIERLSEMLPLREFVRQLYFNEGVLYSQKGEKPKENSKYEKYFNFQEKVASLIKPENSHRYMAIRRGWIEEELKIHFDGTDFESRMTSEFEKAACPDKSSVGAEVLLKAAKISLKAHVISSIENEVHHALRAIADEVAIRVFAENVRKVLLSPPLGAKNVVGVDPGIRTGCKIAIVDESGKYVASSVIHLQSEDDKVQAKRILKMIFENTSVGAVAVGNGTAGRDAESFVRGALKDSEFTNWANVPVILVNEAGASVYSASEAGREEFPDLDVTIRGAISIARRLQDPLAELVKIDPKSIGVGQYQHDISPHALKRSLELVVDSCVNQVGVNLNTASSYLLSHVSGIGESLAKNIVQHREKSGLFYNRKDLLSVERFSEKAFEQSAGFLRIPEALNPLDNTGVHPEHYAALENYAQSQKKTVHDLLGDGASTLKQAADLKTTFGEFTFNDIIKELEKPGRDPRDPFVVFKYREDIHEVSDLKLEMICPGMVTNVTNFGAFVDIGVHQDGLVHLSQMVDRFVKDPREVVSPGDIVQVKVIEVNVEKKQVALSMKGLNPSLEKKSASFTQNQTRPRPQHKNQVNKQDSQRPQHFKNENKHSPNSRPHSKAKRQDHKKHHPASTAKSGHSKSQQPGFNTPFANLANLLKK